MRCPRCQEETTDEGAVFCSRCGAPLGGSNSEATAPTPGIKQVGDGPADASATAPPTQERTPGDATSTQERTPVEVASTQELTSGASTHEQTPDDLTSNRERTSDDITESQQERAAPRELLRDFGLALRRSFVSGGWAEAAGAAGFAFAVIAGAGAVLVVAGKLDAPALGSGANPVEVLSAVVIAGLGCLGVPISFGGLSVSALPLGALALLGYALTWAAQTSVGRRDAGSLGARALEGAKLGGPLAVYCYLAALVFQVGGTVSVAANPVAALLLGGFWGGAFGALGGLRSAGPLRRLATLRLDRGRLRRHPLYVGVVAAGIMLAGTALLAFGAMLLWIIVGLARGGDPTAGDAVAALIYMVAFLPNLLVLVASFALGAPIEVGARVSFGGSLVGGFQSFSMFGWGGVRPGSGALLLVLVPMVACLLGGFSARRNSSTSGSFLGLLAAASLTYAVTLASLSYIGAVRLGAGVTGRGVGQLAPDPAVVFGLALAWAAVFGFIGWKIADVQESSRRGAPAPS